MTGSFPEDSMTITEHELEGVRVLVAHGELDLATAPQLSARLDASRAARVTRLVVDLTDVGFSDSTGLHVLMEADREIQAGGGRLAIVVQRGGPVAELLKVLGVAHSLAVFTDPVVAVTSLARSA